MDLNVFYTKGKDRKTLLFSISRKRDEIGSKFFIVIYVLLAEHYYKDKVRMKSVE